MVVHFQAAMLVRPRTDLDRQVRADHRTQRGIDGVEVQSPFRGIERQPLAFDRIAAARPLDPDNPGLVQRRGLLVGQRMCFRRDQRHIGAVAAQEQRLRHAVAAGADHADALVGDFIAIADRAVAEQPAGERFVMKRLRHVRPVVHHPGR